EAEALLACVEDVQRHVGDLGSDPVAADDAEFVALLHDRMVPETRPGRPRMAASGGSLTLCTPPCSLEATCRGCSFRHSSSSSRMSGWTEGVRGAAASAVFQDGLPGGLPKTGGLLVCQGRRPRAD